MLINAMTIDFSSKNFENPEIQNLYAHIQAIALNEKEIEPVVDYLQPDAEGLKNISDLIIQFRNVVFGTDGYVDPDEKAGIVKQLGQRNSPEKSKKEKLFQDEAGAMEIEGALNSDELEEIEIAVKEDKAGRFTKDKLMKYCKAKKLVTTGTKQDLIDRLAKKLKV